MAIIGLGYIGHRHQAMIDANKEMQLVAVADVRTPSACDAPAGVPFFSSVDEMLDAMTDIDVLSICTPNGYHADIAVKALSHGVNVLMEKPLALNTTDAKRIGDAAKASGARVISVFQNRFTPTSQWLKSIVSDGTIGPLTSIVINCQWNRDGRYYKPGRGMARQISTEARSSPNSRTSSTSCFGLWATSTSFTPHSQTMHTRRLPTSKIQGLSPSRPDATGR